MPTWKMKEGRNLLFRHLCIACHEKLSEALNRDGWEYVRGGEPVSCNECVRKCLLTANGQWGEPDEVRYAVCNGCEELDDCVLKGRYFC